MPGGSTDCCVGNASRVNIYQIKLPKFLFIHCGIFNRSSQCFWPYDKSKTNYYTMRLRSLKAFSEISRSYPSEDEFLSLASDPNVLPHN